ncbi:MAG: hypothetical protein ACRC2V_07735 [Xenococcaceae cyanobacterium]
MVVNTKQTIVQKTTFEHFHKEMTNTFTEEDNFSDEALKLIFDDLKDNFDVQDIWETYCELSLEDFTWPGGWVLPTQESVKTFISMQSRLLGFRQSRFLGFSSEKSVVYLAF